MPGHQVSQQQVISAAAAGLDLPAPLFSALLAPLIQTVLGYCTPQDYAERVLPGVAGWRGWEQAGNNPKYWQAFTKLHFPHHRHRLAQEPGDWAEEYKRLSDLDYHRLEEGYKGLLIAVKNGDAAYVKAHIGPDFIKGGTQAQQVISLIAGTEVWGGWSLFTWMSKLGHTAMLKDCYEMVESDDDPRISANLAINKVDGSREPLLPDGPSAHRAGARPAPISAAAADYVPEELNRNSRPTALTVSESG